MHMFGDLLGVRYGGDVLLARGVVVDVAGEVGCV